MSGTADSCQRQPADQNPNRIFAEPGAEAVAERLRGGDLAALALLPYEVANVAAAKLRRRLVREAHAEAAIALLGQLEVTLYQVAAPKLLQVAGRTGLTAYDAAYLSVARALRADLVTLDVKLGRAFRRMH